MPFSELEVTISSENYTEFLEDLKRVKVNISESGICPEYTLQGLVDVFEYTLPDPYIYVITDSSENDAIIEQNAVTTIEDKNATVRSSQFHWIHGIVLNKYFFFISVS